MKRNGTEARKGQDRETGLGAKHDGPVAATGGDAPNLLEANDHTTSPELLPCPFCGAVPIFGQRTSAEGVPCSNDSCRAEGPAPYPSDYNENIAAWNTRQLQSPDTSPCDEERSRLAGEARNQRTYNAKTDSGYLPRRAMWEHLTPLEQQVKRAMLDVEKMGAHRLLTDAVVSLEHAGRALADWTDLGCPGLAMKSKEQPND